ncbi:MAG: cell wall hydrolase [bacterium]|nr:cell wall hydrolase [bacterium]MCM1376031.1 cell wall hydrolase [Muribaculum sp.]
MYKKALSILVLVHMLFLAGYVCVAVIGDSMQLGAPVMEAVLDRELVADEQSSALGVADVAASGQRVVDYGTLEKPLAYTLSDEDYDILLRIVEAEAGGEDEDGKLLVANVVLNRMNSEAFPNSVKEVVLQRSSRVTQFSPVASGRIWRVEISEETVRAVDRALNGEDISQGAMYFAARRYASNGSMRWFDQKLTFLFCHGGHEFFF